MITTRRTSLTLDFSTYKDIEAVRGIVQRSLGTRLSNARVICAAVKQYRARLEAAEGKKSRGN